MTLVVNLFAGPGVGKSTTMAGVFERLKLKGCNVEQAPEWVKEAVWEGRNSPLGYQVYVFGKQAWRIQRLIDAKVDAIITDSPIVLSCIYGKDSNLPMFHEAVLEQFRHWDTFNIFLRRDPERTYNPEGRVQKTSAEARLIDQKIEKFLLAEEIDHEEIQMGPKVSSKIAKLVEKAMA